MTSETGPVRAVPLDPAAQRRRTWGTSIGILAVIGVVVAAMVIAGHGSGPDPAPVSTQAAVAAAPSTGTAPASVTMSAAAPTSSAAPTSAAVPTASVAPATPTSAAVPRTRAVLDVDGDGRPDSATTQFLTQRTARVVVHLGSGKSLSSKGFPLYHQDGAGKVFAADLNGDHRSELLVSDPGADGIGYQLFTLVGSALLAVPGPGGDELYIGGGMYYDGTFGCTGTGLVQVKERPDVTSTATLPADPPFVVTTTTFTLSRGALRPVGTTTAHVANRAAARAVLADHDNGCGTTA